MTDLNIEPALLILARVLVWLSVFASAIFVARYSRRPWWESPAGRHLMAMGVTLGGILTLVGIMPYLDVPRAVRLTIAVLGYGALLAVLIQRNLLLTRTDRDATAAEAADEPEES